MKRKVLTCGLVLLTFATLALAQDPDGPALTAVDGLTQADIEAAVQDPGAIDLLRTLGLIVFTTPFNNYDGRGDGPFDPAEVPPSMPGHRPTLQGNGAHSRVNGLDAQSCNECHGFVSMATTPPTLGIAGVGGVAQNAMPGPTLIDTADTFDDRVQYAAGHTPDLPLIRDGIADYNGRFINPPFLYGGGGVELLAKEMTADLQELLQKAKSSPAGTVVSLDTHGVHFGFATSEGNGEAELDLEGVGFAHGAYVPNNEETSEHLVVRPFGRKGEAFSMRDFDRGAMQFHFGMQPEEVFDHDDDDGDDVIDEIRNAEMSVLHIFDVTNPMPVETASTLDDKVGFKLFKDAGCASCHRPKMKTRLRYLPLAFPEVPEAPFENVYAKIDLEEIVGFQETSAGGLVIPLFSDLKRHDMGPDLAETCEDPDFCPVFNEQFITARLWGIADTGPYLHDGRALTLYQAIEMHGGEAQTARNNFLGYTGDDQKRLIGFLKTLRTPEQPNEDILP